MDNLDWVSEFFGVHQNQISRIFQAGGCRELWLQGQIFLYLEQDGLQTNATKNKFDLYQKGAFVCEIKVLGGNFQAKVKSGLRSDFDKLASKEMLEDKYVMLVLDKQAGTGTQLYKSLSLFEHGAGSRVLEQDFSTFSVTVWHVL
ncbi:hypothetical protein K6U70_09040 [Vibrio vulnificus]|uniref:hypothetical protein n=1 Tax=Vibrio vulnificus TaxID=672 RepID=UPI001EEA7675|nr:hypothetical protein [Vibrio vulnificus]MCG6272310.1 hypothetical protein [Vibrio vulnificus]